MAAPAAAPSPPLLADAGRRQVRLFAAALVAANVLLPFGLIVSSNLVGKSYATFFWGERNAITWFSSVQLLLVALIAYANHETASLLDRLGVGDISKRRWLWLVFALGFVVVL